MRDGGDGDRQKKNGHPPSHKLYQARRWNMMVSKDSPVPDESVVWEPTIASGDALCEMSTDPSGAKQATAQFSTTRASMKTTPLAGTFTPRLDATTVPVSFRHRKSAVSAAFVVFRTS